MDHDTLVETRRALHGVAETVLAGPEHRAAGTIRLAVTADGFATLPLPGNPSRLVVSGTDLVIHGVEGIGGVAGGPLTRVTPLKGTFGGLAEAAGVEFGMPAGVYHVGSGVAQDDPVEVDPAAAATILRAFAVADDALRRLGAAHLPDDPPVPVLWPEHFDVGISLDEVNYGLSAGDDAIPEPYAYVGPWVPRIGDFWDRPFGAARTMAELGDADGVLAFFEAGRAHASDA